MKNEADFKKHFKASVRAQGGFSISLAAPMLPGIPDLYVVMPGFAPVLLEAKWLKEVPLRFKRTLKFTELQKNFINHCNKVLNGSAWGLIGFQIGSTKLAILHNPNFQLLWDGSQFPAPVTINTQKEFFDVSTLFTGQVPKMNLTYTPTCGNVPVDAQIGDLGADTTRDLAV